MLQNCVNRNHEFELMLYCFMNCSYLYREECIDLHYSCYVGGTDTHRTGIFYQENAASIMVRNCEIKLSL